MNISALEDSEEISGSQDLFPAGSDSPQPPRNVNCVNNRQILDMLKKMDGRLEALTNEVRGIKQMLTVTNTRKPSFQMEKLLPKYITWPSRNQIPRTVQKIKEKKGFPGVLGAIDGTHIPIRTPREFHENYINRKSFHSINLQGICDSNMHFLDVFCGWPGSVHDSRVFKNSPIHGIVENNTEKMFPGNTHLLGDSAYGLTTWLMTPFKDYGNLNRNQKRYNFVHSSTRMMIEHAFGALKGRFHRLKFIDMLDLNKAVKVAFICYVLHELCLLQNDDMNEYIEEGVREMEEINNFFEVHNPSDTAESKRRIIVDNLSI
ncbi:unnamed protein product [Mytilus coruscus]|uniref:DDE Tnp4 domain-containing protein n=1 Tax=Mytilus coruscus TaxID=42192 RepID=A0A6J8ERM8_MYTCO|nr:unnamed protein product [Mytilus coruscus]